MTYTHLNGSIHSINLKFPCLLHGLVLWSMGSMVYIPYRHKQRMKHIHRCNFSFKHFPVTSATKTFLLLVNTFVYVYTYFCFFQASLNFVNDPGLLLVNMATIISGCFPAVSSFLFMSYDFNKNSFCPACARNKK